MNGSLRPSALSLLKYVSACGYDVMWAGGFISVLMMSSGGVLKDQVKSNQITSLN